MAQPINNQRVVSQAFRLVGRRLFSILGLIGICLVGYIALVSAVFALAAIYHYVLGNIILKDIFLHPEYFFFELTRLAGRDHFGYVSWLSLSYHILVSVIMVGALSIMSAWRYIVYNRIVEGAPAITRGMLWLGVYIAPTLLLAEVIYSLGVSLGGSLFIIPGIIFSLSFMLYPYIIARTNIGAIQTFRESYRLMSGHRWHFFKLWFTGSFLVYTPLFLTVPVYYDNTLKLEVIPSPILTGAVIIFSVCALIWSFIILPLCVSQYYYALSGVDR